MRVKTRPDLRDARPVGYRKRAMRYIMSSGRSRISEYLPHLNLENASLTVYDESRELMQTRRILVMVDDLGNAWTNDYNPGQVLSNQVGLKICTVAVLKWLLKKRDESESTVERYICVQGTVSGTPVGRSWTITGDEIYCICRRCPMYTKGMKTLSSSQ